MKVLEYTDEFFIRYGLHGAYTDTISVVLLEGKKIFVSPAGCDLEPAGEVHHYPLLGIDDLSEELVGACLHFLHWFLLWWGWLRCSYRLDVIPDFLHLSFCIGHGWG